LKNQNNIIPLLENISIYSALIPLFVFIIFLNRNKWVQVGVILFYIVVSFTNDQLLMSFVGRPSETFLALSLFTIIEYILFSLFLYLIIKKRTIRAIIVACLPIFLGISIYSYFANEASEFDSLPTTIESIFIITFCIFFLFQELNNPEIPFIYQNPNFWFVFGMLGYLAGNFFLFLQYSNISSDVRDGFWMINLLFNILKNLLFAVAFYLPKVKKDEQDINLSDNFFQTTKLDSY